MPGRAQWVLSFLDALGIDAFVALGHSAGGLVALELGAHHSERARAVALIASPGARAHRPVREYPAAKPFSVALRIPILSQLLTILVRRGFEHSGFPKGLPGEAIRQSMHVVGEMDFDRQAENIERLTVPTLVAWAKDDVFIDLDISEDLAAACPEGPRLKFSEGGHYIQKTQSVEIAEAMVQWIHDLDAG